MIAPLALLKENSLSKRKPNSLFSELDTLGSFDSLFDSLFSDVMRSPKMWRDSHLETIKSEDDRYLLQIGVPGLTSEDVDVELSQQYLLIKYQDKTHKYLLSKDVDKDNIQASVKHGLLEITLPKLEEAKPIQKKIKVT